MIIKPNVFHDFTTYPYTALVHEYRWRLTHIYNEGRTFLHG